MQPAATRIETTPPDLARHRRGNAGIDWVTTLEGEAPGPHLVLNALAHGNELCGAIALVRLLDMGLRPARGRVTLVFANVAAFERFDPANPYASRFVEEDFNRLWSPDRLDGPGDGVELRRARELRPVYGSADALLDLHSMQNRCEPLTLCGTTARAEALARALGRPAWIVSDAGHAAGRRLIDHAPFARADGHRTALLVECGQHWEDCAAEVAFETCLRFLVHFGAVEPSGLGPSRPERPLGPPRTVRVTHAVAAATDRFAFVEPYRGFEIIPEEGTLIAWDADRPVRTPHPDCVLVMPSHRVERGQTAVRLGRLDPA